MQATDTHTDELAELGAITTRGINAHLNDNGLCAVSGSAFRCPVAELAGRTLGALQRRHP